MLHADLLFYFFSIMLVFTAVMVIIVRQSVFSLLFLVCSFIFSSFLLLLLECEFLALLLILVYVGAIAILFLFSIMMIESKLINLTKSTIKYYPVGFIFSFFLLIFVFSKISNHFGDTPNFFISFYLNKYCNWYDLIDSVHEINAYGHVLYSYFVIQFLITGLILLLILLGIVHLTNSYKKSSIQQSKFKQLSRRSAIF